MHGDVENVPKICYNALVMAEITRLKSAEADTLNFGTHIYIVNNGHEGCCNLSEDGGNSLFFVKI